MKCDNLRAFEKHLEESVPHHFHPLYVIAGKEPFECQEALQLLLRFLLPKEKELGLQTFDGTKVEESLLWTALRSPSLFTATRVISIQQADKLKKSIQMELTASFLQPSPSQYLILSGLNWQKNTSFYKAVEQAGFVLEFAEIKPWEKERRLADWINKQVAAERKIMAYPVCQALVKHVGLDQTLLSQELNKLLCYCYDKQEITLQDLQAICTFHPEESIWQLGEAIFQRKSSVALHLVQLFLLDGQAGLPLLRQLRAQFQTQYQLCTLLAQGKNTHDISQEFPYMKGSILERNIRQAQAYGLEALHQGLLAIDATELRLKNDNIQEDILLERLILQLTRSYS